ncbi:MAG: hypothetical protein L0Y42_16350, partial [Phycisphaerales bacterium]|nr:hypothetical protein [Phycisphaerales bacterium]
AWLASLLGAFTANAEVAEFTNRAEWVSAIGGFEQMQTISFLEYPQGSLLNDQYANLGVTFPDGNDFIIHAESFLLDGAGATSVSGPMTLEFDEPRMSIGVHFPGFLIVKLYSEGTLIYTSNEFGIGGAGFFGGLISTQPFDTVHLIDPAGIPDIDTIHFGLPVPAPGGLALLSIAGLLLRRSRRH